MRWNQNFLYGLGTGLILAAIIFGAAELIDADSGSPQSLLFPRSDGSVSEKQLTVGDTSAPAEKNPIQPDQPPAPQLQPKKTVSVTITDGMQAQEIAELLKQKGAITDVTAFLATAGDQSKNIRIGTYELPINGDHVVILRLITSDQSR
jgi:rhodanese-related sulfurtransferase